jgi:hypothetical protein
VNYFCNNLAKVTIKQRSKIRPIWSPWSQPGLPDGIFSNQIITNWVNLRGSCNARRLYILWPIGLHILRLFGLFMAIWYTNFLGKFGAFLPVLVICNKKNLATLEGIKVLSNAALDANPAGSNIRPKDSEQSLQSVRYII